MYGTARYAGNVIILTFDPDYGELIYRCEFALLPACGNLGG